MGKQQEVAALIRKLQECGIDVGQCCVVEQGVFFPSREHARIFSEKHDKDLARVEGQVSGWLAKNKPQA